MSCVVWVEGFVEIPYHEEDKEDLASRNCCSLSAPVAEVLNRICRKAGYTTE